MADKTVTDADIAATLRAAGIDPGDASSRSLSTADDISAVLRAAGIDATVSDKGLTFKEGGFGDTPEERAAIRTNRAVKKTTPPPGPGFPEGEPTPEVREMAKRRGLTGQVISGMPIVGPVMDRVGAAGAAALQPGPFGENYDENLNLTRAGDKLYAKENPLSSLTANVGGSLLGYGPLAATKLGGVLTGTTGPTLGSRLWTGTLGNAAIGTADAALRGDNPIHGGMIGAAGGFAGPLIGEAARGGTNLVASYLWPRTGVLKDMNTGAVNKLAGALDGETPASLVAARERMGPHGFLGDLNTGTTDVAGALADIPGAHKAIVREAYRVRDKGARDRIEQAATAAAGPPVNLPQFERMTTEARKKASDPLYEKWRDTTIEPNEDLQALIPRLKSAGAFNKAEELAGITGDPVNIKWLYGDGSKANFPTAQSWDYVKRGLDASIDAAYSGGDNTKARALIKLKNELVGHLDDLSPVYKQARKTFAGHSSLLDQAQAGKDTFLGGRSGLSADELREELRGLSQPELAARIMGMRAAIKDTMGATFIGDTSMRNKFLAPNNVEKIELMLGKTKAEKLVKQMEQEKFLKEQSHNVSGNSQTTPKKERVNALGLNPMAEYNPNLVQPLSWLPPSWVEQMRPSNVIDAWRGQKHGSTLNQLAEAVTTPEGPKMNDLIAALVAEGQRAASRNARTGAAGNMLSGAISGPGSTTYRRRRALSDDERR